MDRTEEARALEVLDRFPFERFEDRDVRWYARRTALKAMLAFAQEARPAESMLCNLLAVIHRDGGHYIAEHGLQKAYEDAMQLSSERIAARPTLDAEAMREEWGEEEREAISRLAAETELSEHAVLRQALRFYQLMHARIKAGETFSFSGDAQRAREFAGPLASPANPLLLRAYEVVHHDSNCPAIGGCGDGDCRCDAVPFLRDLESALPLPAALSTGEWQPIASVPADTREPESPLFVDLWGPVIGRFPNAYFDTDENRWVSQAADGSECVAKPEEVTHWMPLPAPPAPGGGS